MDLFRRLRLAPGGELISAEIMWPLYARITAQELGQSQILEFASPDDLFVIIDVTDTSDSEDSFVERMLGQGLEDAVITGALIAKNERERHDIWMIREESFLADKVHPHGFWYDISVPQNHLDDYTKGLFERVRAIDPGLMVFLFGHLGDGNLHLTVTCGKEIPALASPVTEAVFFGLSAIGGSISAEHGIGTEKKASLKRHGDPTKVALMQNIKQLLDPKGIMNPGKVL